MSYNFLDKTGLTYFWSKIKAKFDSFSRNDLAVLQTKEYSGIYGSANDQEGASFYFASVRPVNWYKMWRVRYKVYATVPNQNNYHTYSIVEIFGNTTEFSYKVFNRILSTSYRPIMYHNLYRLNSTGYNAGYSHTLGVGLRGGANPTSSSYPRTIKIELLETENCTVTMFDSMIKRSAVSGQGTTNFTGISEIDGCNNGLRETGDDNDVSQLRIENGSAIAGTNGIKNQSLIAQDSTGKYQSFTTTSGTGTTKTVNSSAKFRNPMVIYCSSASTDYASGAELATGYNTFYAKANADLRYSCNNYSNFAKNTPTYLECTKDSDGYFSVTNNIIVQTGFVSGNYYVFLGSTRRDQGYYLTLQTNHPVYYYDGSKLVSETELKADKSSLATLENLIKGADGASSIGIDGVSEWSSTKSYSAYSFVFHNDSLYLALQDTTVGSFIDTEWVELNLTNLSALVFGSASSVSDDVYSLSGRVSDLEHDYSSLSNYVEYTSNKVTNISSSSTDTQYPSALAVYNYVNSAGGGITIDDVYPVGSIYMSVNNTNPSNLFGGTWEQLKDRFLLGAGDTYTAGNTGGEATHTLVANELPKISGTVDISTGVQVNNNNGVSRLSGASGSLARTAVTRAQGAWTTTQWESTNKSLYDRITMNFGNNQAHNNMPPYLVVYMWKRTA